MEVNIGINIEDRKKAVEGLSRLLADSYTLYIKTHNYHWNVTGPMFQTLHGMFEEHYTELQTAVDDIAERIRSLGEFAPGSYKKFRELSAIEEADDVPSAREMISDLLKGHETVIRTARSVVSNAEKATDEATLDLLTRRIDYHEKTAWMLRSMLEE